VNVPKFRNNVLPLHSITPKKEVISPPEKSKNSNTPPCKYPKNTNKQLTTAWKNEKFYEGKVIYPNLQIMWPELCDVLSVYRKVCHAK